MAMNAIESSRPTAGAPTRGGNNLPPYQQTPAIGNTLVGLPPEVAREVANVLGSMAIAKSFPRDLGLVQQEIQTTCSRMELAEAATYTYKRGGSVITGPSIRLAEAMAKAFRNLSFGFEVMSQDADGSKVRAYAKDLETNTIAERVFFVRHENYSATSKVVKLTNGRDMYENIANQAQRRVRACILELIPGDLVDFALKVCDKTLKAGIDITPKLVKKIVEVFGTLGVTKKQIELKLNKKVEQIDVDDFLLLQRIKASMVDEGFPASEFFPPEEPTKKAIESPEQKKEETTPPPAASAPESQETTHASESEIPVMYQDYDENGELFADDFGDAWR